MNGSPKIYIVCQTRIILVLLFELRHTKIDFCCLFQAQAENAELFIV